MDKDLKKLLIRLITMFTVIPVVLITYGIFIKIFKLDLVFHTQIASAIVYAIIFIFFYGFSIKSFKNYETKTAFVFFWFISATIFNLVWQLPLTIFRSHFTTIIITFKNVLYYIPWCGYCFTDAHYRLVDNWMISEELWWFMAIVISIVGLVMVSKKSKVKLGYLLLGVAGLLQAYNATLYIVYDVVSGMVAIEKSAISLILYWGFNLLWPATALISSIISFKRVLNNGK